jgi:Na+/melibiose symporter-like transporter
LLAVYALNGLASAWPATLVLWFMRDQLLAPPWAEGALLALYFAAAALSLPWWTRQVSRHGPVRAWAQGMGLAVLAFAGVGLLPQGQWLGFALVCAGTGVALGADLVAAPTLLARQAGAAQAAGAWWGWWTAAGKLNLALAAGLALPLLQWSGFVPGQRDAASLQVLLWSYALAPCAMKLCALALLWRWRLALASDNPPPRLRGPQPERPCLP